jgi:hypothetical protein
MSNSSSGKMTPVPVGREQLRAASFEQGPSAGAQGELWINRFGHPALISYYGLDNQHFSTRSLETALAVKDERPT